MILHNDTILFQGDAVNGTAHDVGGKPGSSLAEYWIYGGIRPTAAGFGLITREWAAAVFRDPAAGPRHRCVEKGR